VIEGCDLHSLSLSFSSSQRLLPLWAAVYRGGGRVRPCGRRCCWCGKQGRDREQAPAVGSDRMCDPKQVVFTWDCTLGSCYCCSSLRTTLQLEHFGPCPAVGLICQPSHQPVLNIQDVRLRNCTGKLPVIITSHQSQTPSGKWTASSPTWDIVTGLGPFPSQRTVAVGGVGGMNTLLLHFVSSQISPI